MRRSLLAVTLALSLPAVASARADERAPRAPGPIREVRNLPHVVDGDDTTPRPVRAGLTSISHTIFVNSCLPNGCDLTGGIDDAANNKSTIAVNGSAHVSAWNHGDAAWQTLIQCAKDTYSPFDVKVVDQRPTSGTYSEIIVAGSPHELFDCVDGGSGQDACPGGLAPFIDCDGQSDNTISFMFAGDTGNLNYLCGGIAQETCHVFGLDHELNAMDPLTYLNLGSLKSFQDDDAQCGESTPRTCRCGGATQNTYRYLMSMFGPIVLMPASMSFLAPTEGQWVKPGFAIKPTLDDQLSTAKEVLSIDGVQVGDPRTTTPFSFVAPTTLAGGDHTISVVATDKAPRDITGEVHVHVVAACTGAGDAACVGNTSCVNNFCYPGKDTAGGIGATCVANADCISGECASDGTTSICTDLCSTSDHASCPSGYECIADGASAVCFTAAPGGGCNIGGGAGGSILMLAFASLFAPRRRRRR